MQCDLNFFKQILKIFAGDDLITPVYVSATPPPRSKQPGRFGGSSHGVGIGGRPCDDEEDCYIGSGSGEFNTDDGSLTDMEKGT